MTKTNEPQIPYLETAFKGGGFGLALFSLEHPLETIKTAAQARPDLSITRITHKIYQEAGYKGFYAGAIPNGLRATIKHSWRMPLLAFFPQFVKNNFSQESLDSHPDLIPLVTALSMAGAATFSCPFERLKVVLMTEQSKENGSIRTFFESNKGNLGKELFRGLDATFLKQAASWGSFLIANHRVKEWERKRTGVHDLSFTSDIFVSFIVGSIHTSFILPFDSVKTTKQMVGKGPEESFFLTAKKIHSQYGLKAFYAGWQPRLIHYMVYAIFFNTFFKELDNI